MYKIIKLLDGYEFEKYYESINDGCVEVVQKLCTDNCVIQSGSIINKDLIVIDCFAHYESDSYWAVCKHGGGQYCEVNVDDCGSTCVDNIKDSTKLSGGHMW